jgi:hypothetical protein
MMDKIPADLKVSASADACSYRDGGAGCLADLKVCSYVGLDKIWADLKVRSYVGCVRGL